MKQKTFDEIQGIVREVIYAWKPFSWAPDDINDPEFDGEVKGIAKQFERIQSPFDAASAIARVFKSSFGGSDDRFNDKSCADVGRILYQRFVDAGFRDNEFS